MTDYSSELDKILAGYFGAYKTTDDTSELIRIRQEAKAKLEALLRRVELAGIVYRYTGVSDLQPSDIPSQDKGYSKAQIRAEYKQLLNEMVDQAKHITVDAGSYKEKHIDFITVDQCRSIILKKIGEIEKGLIHDTQRME